MTSKKRIYLKSIIIVSLLCFSTLNKSFAQFLNIDRVVLKSGLAFNGDIIKDHKPDYLIIDSEEFGEMKIQYYSIYNVLRKPNPNDPFYKKGAHQYLSAGIGYGSEYGGIGARLQLRFGRKTGFACFIAFGSKEVERYDIYHSFYNYDGTYTSYYEERGTYNAFTFSTGLKFYPYKYFYVGGGILVKVDDFPESDNYFLVGVDYTITKNILLNSSIGYQSTNTFVYSTGNLMINLGINYKITLFSVKHND